MGVEHTDVRNNPMKVVDGLLYGSFLGGSIKTGLVASTTETQVAATLLPATFNVLGTVTASDAVKLKPLLPGQYQIVKNAAAASATVFPNTDQKIDGGTVNAADVALLTGNGSTRLYICEEDDPTNIVSFELNVSGHAN